MYTCRIADSKIGVVPSITIPQPTIGFTAEDESEFPEGRVLYRLHRQRERSGSLVKKKKENVASLACEVCGFDFDNTYGEIGSGYIECHHTTPVSEYEPGQKTKLEDLALVCANCHRMLHRRRPWLSITELRELVTMGAVHRQSRSS